MNTRSFLITALLLTLGQTLHSQTADTYISQGRGYLAATNLSAANISFSNAVAVSPNHQTGNVFYAATRLLTWPLRPTGSNFLSRLGVPNAGRDIYNWTAKVPTGPKHVPLAPAGVNANEFTSMARTNYLTEVIAAEANLAKVTDTTFTLSLTSNETRSVAVTLDYGDIKLLRAMLQAAEYCAYTVYSWNLDAPLAPVYSLYTNDQLSVERLLKDHPSLLTFATTNDLATAKAAMLAGVNRYFEASQFIRARATNVVRLFNYDPEKADDEANFRQTLTSLTNSLTSPANLVIHSTNYTVFLGSQFSGTHPPRPFLPVIRGNGFGLGTLPDPTFGGLISNAMPGVVEDNVEGFLAKSGLFPIPTIAPGPARAGLQFQFPINTLKNRGYTVEVSTNLHDWSTSYAFFSFTDAYAFADTNAYTSPRRFYRIADSTDNMPPPPNDYFANRIPLTGLGITTFSYNASATREPGEPGYTWGATVWWSWTAAVSGLVVVEAFGSGGWESAYVYTGTVLRTTNAPVAYNGHPFNAVAGTTYQIQVVGDPGGIRLVITAPATLTVSTPQNGAASPVPTNFTISASAACSIGHLTSLTFYTDYNLLGSTTNSSLSMTWSNVGVGAHDIEVVATDNLGVTTSSNLTVYVRPPNDSFAMRIPIIGSSATVTGTNDGASKEPGEPNHAGYAGGASVWWSWTSPFNGYITMTADVLTRWGWHGYELLGVYTGTSVSNLTEVASNASNFGESAEVSFVAVAGVTYQIAVDSHYSLAAGGVTLRLIPTEPPVVYITWPTNNAVFSAPTNLTLAASAHDNDGSVARVDFYNNGFLIGSATNAPYTMVLPSETGGSYSLLAKATDNMGASSWSAPVSFYIQPPPFSVSLTSPTEGAEFTAPANIPLSASVFYPPTTNSVVTQVRFGVSSTTTIIGTATYSPYNVVWRNVGPGHYTLVAEAEDSMRNSVFSDPVDIVVNYPETALTLGAPVTNLSGQAGSDVYYKVIVPPGKTSLQISTSGGTGDCDLYVAYSYQPSIVEWDYRPYLTGNNETVTISNPAAGDWHIMVDGYNSYSGVTLLAQ